jgi:hypothetical protein
VMTLGEVPQARDNFRGFLGALSCRLLLDYRSRPIRGNSRRPNLQNLFVRVFFGLGDSKLSQTRPRRLQHGHRRPRRRFHFPTT